MITKLLSRLSIKRSSALLALSINLFAISLPLATASKASAKMVMPPPTPLPACGMNIVPGADIMIDLNNKTNQADIIYNGEYQGTMDIVLGGPNTPTPTNVDGKPFEVMYFLNYHKDPRGWTNPYTGKVIPFRHQGHPIRTGLIAFARTHLGDVSIHDTSTGKLTYLGEQHSNSCVRGKTKEVARLLSCFEDIYRAGGKGYVNNPAR